MGIALFWGQYVIAILMLHTILFGHYDKKGNKVKHPLFLILLGILLLFVPILNIVTYAFYIGMEYDLCDSTFKSFMTKEF